MNKPTKKNLSAVLLLALTVSASALAAEVTTAGASPRNQEDLKASGLLQASGPSLVYFSDASYPVLPRRGNVPTSSTAKADLVQPGKKVD